MSDQENTDEQPREQAQEQAAPVTRIRRGFKYVNKDGLTYSHLGMNDLSWAEAVAEFGDYAARQREVSKKPQLYDWDPPLAAGDAGNEE